MGEPINFRIGQVWLDEATGIVNVKSEPGTTWTLTDAKDEMAAIAKISQGKKLPLLVHLGSSYIEQDARDYYITDEARAHWRACAMLAASPQAGAAGAMWAAAYSHADWPARIYHSEADAIAWLKEFVD